MISTDTLTYPTSILYCTEHACESSLTVCSVLDLPIAPYSDHQRLAMHASVGNQGGHGILGSYNRQDRSSSTFRSCCCHAPAGWKWCSGQMASSALSYLILTFCTSIFIPMFYVSPHRNFVLCLHTPCSLGHLFSNTIRTPHLPQYAILHLSHRRCDPPTITGSREDLWTTMPGHVRKG
jgi:hypothetical protein